MIKQTTTQIFKAIRVSVTAAAILLGGCDTRTTIQQTGVGVGAAACAATENKVGKKKKWITAGEFGWLAVFN